MTAVVTHKATNELGEAVQIVDGKPSLIWVSASLITNADHQARAVVCAVWFEKVGGREKITTEQMTAGTGMHSEIEHYELTGENVLGPATSAGRPFIDKVWQEPSLYKVEHPMVHHKDGKITRAWLFADGTPSAGHIDLVNISGRYIDENGETRRDDRDVVEIKDWKSTSDLKWAKTKEQVADTIQMNTYGAWALQFFDMMQNYERVRLTHVYFQRNRPFKAVLRTSIRTAEQIEAKWKYSTSIVRTIRDAIKETNENAVPANKKACYSYNKACPHIAACSVGSHDSLDSIFDKIASDFKLPPNEEGTNMGLLSDMNLSAPPAPPAPVPQAAPLATLAPQPDMRAQLQAEEERLRAQQQAMQASPPVEMDIKAAWNRIQQHSRGTPALGQQAAALVAQASGVALTQGAGFAGTGELGKLMLTNPMSLYELLNELEQDAVKNGRSPHAAQIVPVRVAVAPPPPPAPLQPITVGDTVVNMTPSPTPSVQSALLLRPTHRRSTPRPRPWASRRPLLPRRPRSASPVAPRRFRRPRRKRRRPQGSRPPRHPPPRSPLRRRPPLRPTRPPARSRST
jgi:hypothetical protein